MSWTCPQCGSALGCLRMSALSEIPQSIQAAPAREEVKIMKLGDLLKARREAAGMSLQDVADACKLSKGYVWEIESGKSSNIGLVTALRLSICLGIPVNAMAAAAIEDQP